MGVYHFCGLGKSIGAITAAFSYLGAIWQQGGAAAEALFSLSDERERPEEERGLVQALVLFTTKEIARGERGEFCEPYLDNEPGRERGREKGRNRTVKEALVEVLGKELKAVGMVQPDKQKLDVYWCEHERHDPLQTFERVYTVLQAAKPEGSVGKECWINLTGGSNVINGALQLATSLLGTAARQYYLLSENPRCLHHTVPLADLGSPEKDRFWVELPIVYANFSQIHRAILEELATAPDDGIVTHGQLHGRLCANPDFVQQIGLDAAGDTVLRRTILQPLRSQKLIIHVPGETAGPQDRYQIGPAWPQMARYLQAMDKAAAANHYQSLTDIDVPWFRKETIAI